LAENGFGRLFPKLIRTVARFFLRQYTKTGKNVPNENKGYLMVKNIPNVVKTVQVLIKYPI
jgi:hypothetical protein